MNDIDINTFHVIICSNEQLLYLAILRKDYVNSGLLKLAINHHTKIVKDDEESEWYANGKRHRIGGPAIEYPSGSNLWYVNGKRHRIDGPAVTIEFPDNSKVFYSIDGDFHALDNNKQLAFELKRYKRWHVDGEFHALGWLGRPHSHRNHSAVRGYKRWHVNGELHRIDGPAIEYANGGKEWYINGKCHRTDGPAIEYSNGSREWRVNGIWHRIDGPAIEHFAGSKDWYVNGKRHRTDGPAVEHIVENVDGPCVNYIEYTLRGIDGPTTGGHYCSTNAKLWFIEDKFQRIDSSVIETIDSTIELYLNGKRIN